MKLYNKQTNKGTNNGKTVLSLQSTIEQESFKTFLENFKGLLETNLMRETVPIATELYRGHRVNPVGNPRQLFQAVAQTSCA